MILIYLETDMREIDAQIDLMQEVHVNQLFVHNNLHLVSMSDLPCIKESQSSQVKDVFLM